MPIIVKQRLQGGPSVYGLLLGSMGAGSLVAAVLLPRLSRFVSFDKRQQLAALFLTVGLVSMATVTNLWVLSPLLVLSGMGWLMAMVGFNIATQQLAPSWVQARVLSFYVLFSQGGLAVGSFLWGSIASHAGLSSTLGMAAVGTLGGLAAPLALPITRLLKDLDTASAGHDLDARLSAVASPDDGPVLVTVEYRIDPAEAAGFLRAVHELEPIRRRDGAIRWEVYRDLEEPGRWVEQFVVESWAEHVRQHMRLTRRDAKKQAQVHRFHVGSDRPRVAHCLFERVPRDLFPWGR
jgi:quinol monooxygenase YgiN